MLSMPQPELRTAGSVEQWLRPPRHAFVFAASGASLTLQWHHAMRASERHPLVPSSSFPVPPSPSPAKLRRANHAGAPNHKLITS